MSWLEKIESGIIIETGDAELHFPLWKPTKKSIEYNVAEFEFPEVEGTLVYRGTPKGARHELEFYFQGEDHLEKGQAFEVSAKDPRPWIISHPYHGSITVQPIGLEFDYNKYNTTRITGSVVETITDNNPKTKADPVDTIKSLDAQLLESSASSYANNNPRPTTANIQQMRENNANLYDKAKKAAKGLDSQTYFNLYNTANSAIALATSKPLEAMRALQAAISYPGQFADTVKNRLTTLVDQFNKLRESLDNLITPDSKRLYENNATTLISSIALATATPLDVNDYGNRKNVISIIESVTETYNIFLTDLDGLQTDNGGGLESYIPDATVMIELNNLVNFTVSELFNIALNAKQERVIYLEDDNNLITLTHRLYGLKPDDSTIDELMLQNNIGLNEMLQIKKGRRIVYYI